MRSRQRLGFTLVEMLIVVAILGALASILLPMLFKAKAAARKAECLSNLKQLGTAWLAYAEKFNGFGPHTDDDGGANSYGWFDALDGFIGDVKFSRVKQCPMWEGYRRETTDEHSIKMNDRICRWDLTYATASANGALYAPFPGTDPKTADTTGYYFAPISRTKDPSNTVVFFDGRMSGNQNVQSHGIALGRADALRHDGETCILFMNGGAQAYNAESAGIMQPDGTWTTLGPFIWQPIRGIAGR